MLDQLNSQRFLDCAPHQVFFALLDDGQYLCSPRTMYRILHDHHQVRERRAVRQQPVYTKPELLATGPNQVWSWDITKLRGPQRGQYFHLYVVLDLFSRYVVGWLLAGIESGSLAKRLVAASCRKQGIGAGELVLHSDRGAAMTSQALSELLKQLEVTRSLSRPYTPDDNAFSESQFRTLKYHPDFPERFESLSAAQSYCRSFMHWYNHEHYHSGIGYLPPATVHFGQSERVIAARQSVLLDAYQRHPERFSRPPQAPRVPAKVWLNPPVQQSFSSEERAADSGTSPRDESLRTAHSPAFEVH